MGMGQTVGDVGHDREMLHQSCYGLCGQAGLDRYCCHYCGSSYNLHWRQQQLQDRTAGAVHAAAIDGETACTAVAGTADADAGHYTLGRGADHHALDDVLVCLDDCREGYRAVYAVDFLLASGSNPFFQASAPAQGTLQSCGDHFLHDCGLNQQ